MSEIDIGKELVTALINRISWLEWQVGSERKDLEVEKRKVEEWKKLYETERGLRAVQEEKLDAAIEKLYEFIGLNRNEWG